MKDKDWTGNSHSTYVTLGASNHTPKERELNDYYATEPKAVEILLKEEKFNEHILEPACGGGHISEVLLEHGYKVTSTDLVYRDYGLGGVDFLKQSITHGGDIITNPPYKYALEFVRKSLEVVEEGHKVAMLLRLLFLESKSRKKLFEEHPPRTVYVSSSRLKCAINGDFDGDNNGSSVAYAWFVWEKGYKGDTIIKWIN